MATNPFNKFDPAADPRELALLDANFERLTRSSAADEGLGALGFDPSVAYAPGSAGDAVKRSLAAISLVTGTANQITLTVTGTGDDEVLVISLPTALVAPGNLVVAEGLTVVSNVQLGASLTVTGDAVVGGTLGVSDNAGFAADVGVVGQLSVQGPVAMAGALGVGTSIAVAGRPIDQGWANGSDAATGKIGEVLVFEAGPQVLVSGSTQNIHSFTLPAGDWDLSAVVTLSADTAASMTYAVMSLSIQSGTLGPRQQRHTVFPPADFPVDLSVPLPTTRLNAAANRTVYVTAIFGSPTAGDAVVTYAYVRARRAR